MNDAAQYHIDPNDMSLRRCGRSHDCAWATPEEHYTNLREGYAVVEEMMRPLAWVRFHKRTPGHKHAMEVLTPVR